MMGQATLDGLFRFPIGGWVRHKQDGPALNPMMVVSRTLEQCYGGVQCHYSVRLYGPSSGTQVCLFSEIELEEARPPAASTTPNLANAIYDYLEILVDAEKHDAAKTVRDMLDWLGTTRPE